MFGVHGPENTECRAICVLSVLCLHHLGHQGGWRDQTRSLFAAVELVMVSQTLGGLSS